MNGSISSTVVTDQIDDLLSLSRTLGLVATHSSAKRASSLITKTCNQASTLFLTRRLPEALETLETVINPPGGPDGSKNGETPAAPALIASANRSLRVKVWNLYLTLLDTVIELGLEEGKVVFGNKNWRSLAAKAREGTIWDEIVNAGYGGSEGNVDADVVVNLVTLLLTHSSSQMLTQNHLEIYLSAARHPNLEVSDCFGSSIEQSIDLSSRPTHMNGTYTPRDLILRIKILELYTLHVLPRNEEWQYAKDFIATSELLDAERREAFLHSLQSLEEQNDMDKHQKMELMCQRDEDRERERRRTEKREEEERRLDSVPAKLEMHTKGHRRSDSEKDYGIDDPLSTSTAMRPSGPSNLNLTKQSMPGNKLSPPSRAHAPSKKASSRNTSTRALLATLRYLVPSMMQLLSNNPTITLRTVLFVVALIMAFGRRDVRNRVGRITGFGWNKIKGTVGMGIKVSYL